MKFKELIENPELLSILHQNAPTSKFSGKPLTLTHDSLGLSWSNCMEPEWGFGAADGVYTHQDIRRIPDATILAAAEAAGLDPGDIAAAFVSRVAEAQAIIEAQNDVATVQTNHTEFRRAAAVTASHQRLAKAHPELLDPNLATAAEAELAELLRRYPRVHKMTRKGTLLDDQSQVLATFTNLLGMRAWLFQHGHRASIDLRDTFLQNLQ